MIIGISGKIGSGKDTVGKIIQYLTSDDCSKKCLGLLKLGYNIEGYHNSNWQIKKFAGKLKLIVSILTGISVEDLEKQEVKDRVLGKEWDRTINNGFKVNLPNEMRKITVRQLLQWVGTDAMRNVIHPNTWVNALFVDYVPISDISKSNIYTDSRLQHGYKGTKIWRTYHNIKQRCTNSKHPRYNDYGGRSITMCEEWLNDISSFINWAIENGYNESLTIDRIDNNKGYSPDNCRCVSYAVQSINTNLRKDNTSGYRGVSKDSHNWRAQIQIKGKQKFLGYFNTAEEASEAYENAFMEREGLYLKEEEINLIYPSWCITDLRFPNELKAIKDRGGITIRVNRPVIHHKGIYGSLNQDTFHKVEERHKEEISRQHPSETALDNAEFDFVIDNNKDIEHLVNEVKSVLQKLNLLNP